MTVRVSNYSHGKNIPHITAYDNGFVIAGAFIPEDLIWESSFEPHSQEWIIDSWSSPFAAARSAPSGPVQLTLSFLIDQYTVIQGPYRLGAEDKIQW